MRLFILLALFSSTIALFAKEAPQSFIIFLDQGRIRVIGPEQPSKIVSIIVENKSLVSYHLKLINKERNLNFFSVAPGESRSIEAMYDEARGLSLVPMSPPLSQIDLLFGKPPYEIPPKE